MIYNINPVKSNKKFNVIILAAGLGSRLGSLTDKIPKPMITVDSMSLTAIDFLISKFKNVADKFFICTGRHSEQFEKYLSLEFSNEFKFIRQQESELSKDPGKSAILGIRATNVTLPTIILFCDILFEDLIIVECDTLGICLPTTDRYVYGTYKTLAITDEYGYGVISDIKLNPDVDKIKMFGWTGLFICHDTKLLKYICDNVIKKKDIMSIDYAFDIVRPYIRQKHTICAFLSNIYEFGTLDVYNELMEKMKR